MKAILGKWEVKLSCIVNRRLDNSKPLPDYCVGHNNVCHCTLLTKCNGTLAHHSLSASQLNVRDIELSR